MKKYNVFVETHWIDLQRSLNALADDGWKLAELVEHDGEMVAVMEMDVDE
ncbi:MAG: hypothetical protein IJS40_07780 [Synergistaceae bacterium]|nr:hypothetical protein [Synergistaceae bacterium]